MDKYLSNKAKRITPYTAGAQPEAKNIIKLNTNENPYPLSPATRKAYNSFDVERLRLYPHPQGGKLKKTIADLYRLPESHVFCGNGSDEVLAFAFDAFFDSGIVFADITYSFYPVWADLFDISYTTIPLNKDFTMPVDRLVGNGVVIANPNAPTGIALPLADIEKVLTNNKDHVVIVDEAYDAFGSKSAAALVPQYENLLVVKTLSKSHSLAGMRVGYAIGQSHLIDGLVRIKDSFNSYPVDMVAQTVASAALSDTQYYADIAKKIVTTRENTARRLCDMGFSVLPSCTNFLFVTKAGESAQSLKEHLEQSAIYVRHFNAPRISEYLRITIGTDAQMEQLIAALRAYGS